MGLRTPRGRAAQGPVRAPLRPREGYESAAEGGLFVEPGQLVRVADRVDAGDPAVLDHEGDRGVELAGRVDPRCRGAVEPHRVDPGTGCDLRELGEEPRHRLGTLDRAP